MRRIELDSKIKWNFAFIVMKRNMTEAQWYEQL